ncbi:MAG: SLC13 family permease [Planctomycetota bacterium]
MQDLAPIILLVVGIVSVLGMIIGLKLNAFLALILSALIVSLGVGWVDGGSAGSRMNAVKDAFGVSAGGIGIVIAMAAIIGKCMLDSGAADRIVRTAVSVTGEKKASLGLTVSGFVLAIPVFFDTVFYLLVPLARSLYQRTKKNYLRYLMAIATGGAITHTLVPPTPGPLLVAAILGVDLGMMMLVGALVAIPAAVIGLLFSVTIDKKMPIEMRPIEGTAEKHEPLPEEKLPSFFVSLLPVVIPVILIGIGTLAGTLADREDRAQLVAADLIDASGLAERIEASEEQSPLGRIRAVKGMNDERYETLLSSLRDEEKTEEAVGILNDVLLAPDFYDRKAFLGIDIGDVAQSGLGANQLRMKPVDRRRMNRALLEDAEPEMIEPHEWDSTRRWVSNRLSLYSNPNFALTVAAICAMLTLKITRSLSWKSLGEDVEQSLLSGGIIILITAAGGAFGAMLGQTNISDSIQTFFEGSEASGMKILLLGWTIAAVLKVAQGSSTVAMIVGAGMMSAIIGTSTLNFNMVYVATAVGSGSLMGSWMNDSGFWVFTKMGGLKEAESLKSWTPLLGVLSVTGLVTSLILSAVLPLAG